MRNAGNHRLPRKPPRRTKAFRRSATRALLLAALLSLSAAACERIDRNMWENPAYGPQSAPVRTPPKGSVPTKGISRPPSLADAVSLKNPVAGSAPDIARGRELFGAWCTPCHGPAGRGDGAVGARYTPKPVNLGPGGPVPAFPDGTVFAMIANGFGGMPPLASDLPERERWQVVAYLRTLR